MSDYLTSLITAAVAPASEVRPRLPMPFEIDSYSDAAAPLSVEQAPAPGETWESSAGWLGLLAETRLPTPPAGPSPAGEPEQPASPARRAAVPRPAARRPPLRARSRTRHASGQQAAASPDQPAPASRPLAHAALKPGTFRAQQARPQPAQDPSPDQPAAQEHGTPITPSRRGEQASAFQRLTIRAARQPGKVNVPRQDAPAPAFPSSAPAGLPSPASDLSSSAPASRLSPILRPHAPPVGAAVLRPQRSSQAPADAADPLLIPPERPAPTTTESAKATVLLRPQLPPEPRPPAPQRKSAAPEQSIHITIGRIEIRANPALPVRASQSRPAQPRLLTLEEYQRQRNAEGNRP